MYLRIFTFRSSREGDYSSRLSSIFIISVTGNAEKHFGKGFQMRWKFLNKIFSGEIIRKVWLEKSSGKKAISQLFEVKFIFRNWRLQFIFPLERFRRPRKNFMEKNYILVSLGKRTGEKVVPHSSPRFKIFPSRLSFSYPPAVPLHLQLFSLSPNFLLSLPLT